MNDIEMTILVINISVTVYIGCLIDLTMGDLEVED